MTRWISRTVLALVLLVILTLVFLYFTSGEREGLTRVEEIVRDAFAPLQNGVAAVRLQVNGLNDRFTEVEQLMGENAELKNQINQLTWENSQLTEAQAEVQRLQKMFDFDQANPEYRLLGARVISRGPNAWYNTLSINQGSSAGVVRNMAVITPEGLVGRVLETSQNTAEVLLITDREGPVGSIALTQESRIPGVVEGLGDGTDILKMKYIPYDAEVEPGQYVVTSGLGETFPKGIRIGRIQAVDQENEPSGMQKEAIIQPEVDFDRLEEVFVVLQGAPAFE